MVRGSVQKCETLQDGSIKLSIYVNKEDIQLAFPLAYKEVNISEVSEGVTESKAEALTRLANAFQDGLDILKTELEFDEARQHEDNST